MDVSNIHTINERFNLNCKDLDSLEDAINKQIIDTDQKINSKIGRDENLLSDYRDLIDARHAISGMKKGNSTAIALTEDNQQLSLLIKEILPTTFQKDAETKLSGQIENKVEKFQNRSRISRYGLTVLSGVLTFLVGFPPLIGSYPFFGDKIFQNSTNALFFYSIWVFSLIITIEIWIFYFRSLTKIEQYSSDLKVESYQNILFNNFLHETQEKSLSEFSKMDLINFLLNDSKQRERNITIHLSIVHISDLDLVIMDNEMAQNLADILLTRAEAGNLIQKLPKKSLDKYFTII